jgi:uncharacterized Tic20 family protein
MNASERSWVLGCHLAALALLLRVPSANILGPLIVWLAGKHQRPTLDQQGRHILNFQITMTLVFALLWLVLRHVIPVDGVVHLLIRAWEIINLTLVIIAAVRVSHGQTFRYPLTLRFIPAPRAAAPVAPNSPPPPAT